MLFECELSRCMPFPLEFIVDWNIVFESEEYREIPLDLSEYEFMFDKVFEYDPLPDSPPR